VVQEIQKKGRASSKHVADVSQDEQVKGMVDQVVERHGGLDVVRVFVFLSFRFWDSSTEATYQMVANAGVVGKLLPFHEGNRLPIEN